MNNLTEDIMRIRELCDKILKNERKPALQGNIEIMNQNYKTLSVNGLEWLASENLYIPELAFYYQKEDTECYYTYHHLPAIQKILDDLNDNWRIPTKDDYESLRNLGSSWYKKDNISGRFFGKNHEEATPNDPRGCIFFPASGYRSPATGVLNGRVYNGYGWSSTQVSATFGYYLLFDSADVYPAYSNLKAHGFPVRIVRDVKN